MSEPCEIETRVRAIIGRVFNLAPEAVTPGLRLGNPPQWDSIGHMELLVAIENDFGVRFRAHDIAALTTVDAIATAVRAAGPRTQ
jgi:acyl carrier protein